MEEDQDSVQLVIRILRKLTKGRLFGTCLIATLVLVNL